MVIEVPVRYSDIIRAEIIAKAYLSLYRKYVEISNSDEDTMWGNKHYVRHTGRYCSFLHVRYAERRTSDVTSRYTSLR
jgi:hypothetical protein